MIEVDLDDKSNPPYRRLAMAVLLSAWKKRAAIVRCEPAKFWFVIDGVYQLQLSPPYPKIHPGLVAELCGFAAPDGTIDLAVETRRVTWALRTSGTGARLRAELRRVETWPYRS